MIAEIEEQIDSDSEDTVEELPFDPDRVPTQVKMIELLQFIASKSYLSHLTHIAVIISAWDRIKSFYKSPEEWLIQQTPLLDQYFKANQGRFTIRIYGVSAQGGEILKEGTPADIEKASIEAARLAQFIKPSERIIVQERDSQPHHDITSPIKWLVEHEGIGHGR